MKRWKIFVVRALRLMRLISRDRRDDLLNYLILESSPLFDGDWYLKRNNDVAKAGVDPVWHYLHRGHKKGYQPSPEFNGKWYSSVHPEIGLVNPLVHYLTTGINVPLKKAIDRKLCDKDRIVDLVLRSGLFDVSWYAKQCVEARAFDVRQMVRHYLDSGWKCGLDPSKRFSTNGYLAANQDVRRRGVCPLEHWLLNGRYECRRVQTVGFVAKNCRRRSAVIEKAFDKRLAGRSVRRRILLVSHELTYTGAPLSLLKAAQCYHASGYEVVTCSIKPGPLFDEFAKVGEVFVIKDEESVVKISMRCVLSIVNTLVPYHFYQLLRPLLPTVWWIRESPRLLESAGDIRKAFMSGENLYAMSNYSAWTLAPYNSCVRIIKHGLDDEYRGVRLNVDKPMFCVIGTIQERKGQDVFVQAVTEMSPAIRDMAEFVIVGSALSGPYLKDIKKRASGLVRLVGQINDHEQMLRLYESMACAVVPSREEPTSRVAIEAMMMGRPVIMSDHTGARYLVNEKNGRVFKSEDASELRRHMEELILHPNLLRDMEASAREAYQRNNSMAVYKAALLEMVDVASQTYEDGYGTLLRNCWRLASHKAVPCRDSLKVSVIVPVHNARDEVERLMRSLAKSEGVAECEVILVDDCSDEETAAYLRRVARENGYVHARNDENLGFVKTCNRGMRMACGDIVVLLNSDTVVPANFSERILACFRSDRRIACASPVAVHSGWFDLSFVEDLDLDRVERLVAEASEPCYPGFTPEGFCLCCRKSALDDVGLLDEVYGMGYCEEDDLVMRFLRKGYRTVLIDDLIVYHKRHASFSSERRQVLFQQNRKIFFERYGGQQEFIRNRFQCRKTTQEIARRIHEAVEEGYK